VLVPPLCWGCGGLARRGEPLCLRCRRCLRRLGDEPRRLAGLTVWAPLAYEGPARELVRALKFRSAARVAGTMAAQMAASAPPALIGGDPVLVPVPLRPARRRRRGYNQARLLADELGARTGLALCDCLERRGGVGTQAGRSRSERRLGPPGRVGVRAPPAPARVLLVDDVVTTGATLSACAAVLRRAGTRSVAAIAFARTPGR
jgi:ComF family protein